MAEPDRAEGIRRERATAWRLADGTDLERTLVAAERLLQNAEERHRHAQNRSFALFSVLATLGLAVIGSSIAFARSAAFGDNPIGIFGAAATLSATSLIAVPLLSGWLRERRLAQTDKTLQLAAELASIVGEILSDVADREAWSHVRVHTTRLRLSAFPLPSDAQSRRLNLQNTRQRGARSRE